MDAVVNGVRVPLRETEINRIELDVPPDGAVVGPIMVDIRGGVLKVFAGGQYEACLTLYGQLVLDGLGERPGVDVSSV